MNGRPYEPNRYVDATLVGSLIGMVMFAWMTADAGESVRKNHPQVCPGAVVERPHGMSRWIAYCADGSIEWFTPEQEKNNVRVQSKSS